MRPTQIVEAALFASQSPLTPRDIARADESLTVQVVEEALAALREEYERLDRSFQIYNLGDGYQILTRPEYAPYLERFDSVPRTQGLSPAALETLAIIAYRQPISRAEIEDIRGVGSTTVLRTLQEWELVDVVGRGEGIGRPLLYGTTRRLLDHFGLRALSDLPRLEDLPVTLRSERTLEVPPEPLPGAAAEEVPEAPDAVPETDSDAHEGVQQADDGAPDARVEEGAPAAPGEATPEVDPPGQRAEQGRPDAQEPATV